MELKKEPEKGIPFFADRKLNELESKTERDKNKKNFIRIIILSSILILTLLIYSNYNSNYLKNNGVITSGIVKSIRHNAYRMNDMDGTHVNNYRIEYEFISPNGVIRSLYEIRTDIYESYFDKTIKENDTIRIRYNPKNPKENEIIRKK